MTGTDVRDRVLRLAAWLDASPSELAGLAILLVGAGLASLALYLGASPNQPTPVLAETALRTEQPASTLLVHVAGAVASPGVVSLLEGARVADALAAAGGVVFGGDTDALNLARELADGERIFVGVIGAQLEDAAETASAAHDGSGRLKLNAATASDLQELPGIGPVLAQRIIDHRTANGPFAEVGDLRAVPGIGERTFQLLAELLTL